MNFIDFWWKFRIPKIDFIKALYWKKNWNFLQRFWVRKKCCVLNNYLKSLRHLSSSLMRRLMYFRPSYLNEQASLNFLDDHYIHRDRSDFLYVFGVWKTWGKNTPSPFMCPKLYMLKLKKELQRSPFCCSCKCHRI